MPDYRFIDENTEEGQRTAAGALRLKRALSKQVPARRVRENLLLATWNIRELGGTKGGGRSSEPLMYMAEIISAFDIVAVQEVRDDLAPLEQLMKRLGRWWRYLLTDVSEGPQGNRERMAFLYDSRKINFGGFTAKILLPGKRGPGGTVQEAPQFARAPFMVGFQAGWFKFTICTAHLYYGTSEANNPQRVREIAALAEHLASQVQGPWAWAKSMILLGDFNIFAPSDLTMEKLLDAGFKVPSQLSKSGSNVDRSKHYDQIAFIARRDVQKRLDEYLGGVFDMYKYVYREKDEREYASLKRKSGMNFKMWRTYQLSDHLPMWIELPTDFSEMYLVRKTGNLRARK